MYAHSSNDHSIIINVWSWTDTYHISQHRQSYVSSFCIHSRPTDILFIARRCCFFILILSFIVSQHFLSQMLTHSFINNSFHAWRIDRRINSSRHHCATDVRDLLSLSLCYYYYTTSIPFRPIIYIINTSIILSFVLLSQHHQHLPFFRVVHQ